MYLNTNQRPTTQPLIATWNKDLGFKLKGSPILGNELTIALKGLTESTSYWMYVKPAVYTMIGQLVIVPDDSSISAFEVLTGVGETEKNAVIQLVESQGGFRVGQEYLVALKNEDQEKLQIKFTISQNAILNRTGSVVKNFPSEDWTLSGSALSPINNKVVDEKGLELDDITVFDNTRIPTNLAVQAYVASAISNFNLDSNSDFTALKDRVTDVETNKRNISDSYSRTEIENKDTALQSDINNRELASNKGVANGYASLDANAKIPLSEIPDSILGQLEYQGVFDFSGGLPPATEKGQFWVAQVAGSGYEVGDWAVYNGTSFDKVDNTDAVSSVQGRTGNVVITKTDLSLQNVDNIKQYPNSNPSSFETPAQLDARDTNNRNRANHIGTQLANTISDFDTQVRTNRLDQLANPIADADLNNQKIINLGDPTNNADAVNRLFITSNILPLEIVTAVQNYKTRFSSATDYQILSLSDFLKKEFINQRGEIPAFLVHPYFNLEIDTPASTTFYNAGSFNGGDGSLTNATVSSILGEEYQDGILTPFFDLDRADSVFLGNLPYVVPVASNWTFEADFEIPNNSFRQNFMAGSGNGGLVIEVREATGYIQIMAGGELNIVGTTLAVVPNTRSKLRIVKVGNQYTITLNGVTEVVTQSLLLVNRNTTLFADRFGARNWDGRIYSMSFIEN